MSAIFWTKQVVVHHLLGRPKKSSGQIRAHSIAVSPRGIAPVTCGFHSRASARKVFDVAEEVIAEDRLVDAVLDDRD